MSRLRGAFGAFTVGFVVGVFGLAIEWVVSGSRLKPDTAACYGLMGGLAAASAHFLIGLSGHETSARLAALVASAPIIAFQLGYAVNVSLLTGEHYLSGKSLLADFFVLAPILVIVLIAGTSRFAHAARGALGGSTAMVGMALLASSLVTLVTAWPSRPTIPARAGSGPDLVLVVMDSVRRDRIGSYGHRRPTSPHFDALAKEGTLFESAQSGGPWTLPSVRVLLGRNEHSNPGLTKQLVARGYVTACFTDNPHLVRGSPILNGFDYVERSVGKGRLLIQGTLISELFERLNPGSDDELVRRAVDWASAQSGPFFLYVHLMDAHTPYRFPQIDGHRRPGRRVEFPVSFMHLTADEADDIRARYEGGIRSADAALGRLFDGLGRQHKPLVTIVTADHGENLGERGIWFHGSEPTPERLAVPLLIRDGSGERPRLDLPVGFETIPTALLAAAGDGPITGTILDPSPTLEAQLRWRPADLGAPGTAPRQESSPDARERLRALGYVAP